MKKFLALLLTVVLTATTAISGTLAYLQHQTEPDVNVMTLGSVKIKQHEYQRATNEDGSYKIATIDNRDSYVLEGFAQAKPLLPAIISNGGTFNGVTWDYDAIPVRMSQVGSHGGASVFNTPNAQDKFVTVENTGKSDAYVRTIIAFEVGSAVLSDETNYPNQPLISSEIRAEEAEKNTEGQLPWTYGYSDYVTIDGNKYLVYELIYTGAKTSSGWKHENGVLPAGETTYPNLCQVYMASRATNEDVEALDGNNNGTYDILVLSQAIQTAGFEDAASTFSLRSETIPAAKVALDTGFGETNEVNVQKWFGDIYIPNYSIPLAVVDADGNITFENGESAVLSGEQGAITVSGNGTLYLRDVNAKSINVEGAAVELIVEGDVSVESDNGSAITGTVLDISGTPGATLTAIAADEKGAFGIGGMTTTAITIENLTIKEVSGGYDGEIGTDTKYYKDTPEGGAAIGSGADGAVITLENVHIEKAIGGSKAAGIGARYWTGVNITIKNSTIDYVEGGATAAGIGGSRVSEGQTESGTSISIVDSRINAKGGVYGAGIGSGYDTHCKSGQPITTINITGNSVITAQGGQYAAGVGTGYHNAGLAGKIESTVTVNATSGEKFYKDTYTQAQDIGFGVVDPAREAKDNSNSITYNDENIGIPSV